MFLADTAMGMSTKPNNAIARHQIPSNARCKVDTTPFISLVEHKAINNEMIVWNTEQIRLSWLSSNNLAHKPKGINLWLSINVLSTSCCCYWLLHTHQPTQLVTDTKAWMRSPQWMLAWWFGPWHVLWNLYPREEQELEDQRLTPLKCTALKCWMARYAVRFTWLMARTTWNHYLLKRATVVFLTKRRALPLPRGRRLRRCPYW